MQTFIMLTRLEPGAMRSSQSLEDLERKAMDGVRKSCSDVKWLGSYAVVGPYDYVDIFQTPNIDTASKVSALVRTHGHTRTEIWAATEWAHFKEVVRSL